MNQGRASYPTITRVRLSIRGIVQGVGFRPFVYRLAQEHNLKGFVRNTSTGVTLEVEGPPDQITAFTQSLQTKAPPLAKITGVVFEVIPIRGDTQFQIIDSQAGESRIALISPDIAVCDDCLRELFDPKDRRFHYPFINCTNCGPRYTIVQDIPYDRANTTMRIFTMCPECESEYHDPANRRFHAQPNACPACGPRIWLIKRNEAPSTYNTDRVVAEAAARLREGAILAIKGIGGFHLAVDATNDHAVRRLRERKRREQKALAIMSPDLDTVRLYAHISDIEARLLTSPQRPIVLLKKRDEHLIATSVAPRSKYFGVMLPYAPLHYLLFHHGFLALVMTSGNVSEEPIAIDNAEALTRLGDIADFFLLHDRDIYLRADDSVTRVDDGEPIVLRRARGYAPAPIILNIRAQVSVLAVGAELKNTVCLTKGENAFISQHVGDLKNLPESEFFEMTIQHLKTIFEIEPRLIAHDLHPDYRSTRYALEQRGLERVAVQHHHAHIASCLAEHGRDEKVIGLAFDGTGYGADGLIWGGEFLVADLADFERVAHLRYIPMPGGDRAIEEADRMALSYLYVAFGEDIVSLDLDLLKRLGENKMKNLLAMIRSGVNAPLTSSVGRLFDAVSAFTGVCHRATYEGQPAIELEGVADHDCTECYEYAILDASPMIVDFIPMIRSIVTEMQKPTSCVRAIAARLHNTLAQAAVEVCKRVRAQHGLHTVVLSGGVFQNQLLALRISKMLRAEGFEVLRHHSVPPNDGGISLGQAAVALRRFSHGSP